MMQKHVLWTEWYLALVWSLCCVDLLYMSIQMIRSGIGGKKVEL